MTNFLESCTEKVQETFADTIKPINKIDIKQNAEQINENEVDKDELKTIPLHFQYLIQVEGDPEFRLPGKSARKNRVKAELTAAGWVYQKKEDAEEVATRWTQGKRKLRVVLWYDSRVDDIWNRSKDEARLAKKSISLEIESTRVNARRQEIILQCHQSPLHPSWLYAEDISKLEVSGCSEKEKQAYEYFKPLWDKIIEEEKELDLRDADIAREKEDLKDSLTTECGQEVFVGGIPKTVTDMQSLDKRFAQLETPGQPCVLINRLDAQPISPSDFSRRLSGEVVRVDSEGQSKYISASKFWEGNSRKHIYKKIAFTNQQVSHDTYNLFTGFGVKPKEGKCDKILEHIKDVICAGNEINYTAFLNLLAWQIQNIGKPSRIITALKSSQQQSGKGILLEQVLGHIYGNSGFQTNDMGQITTRFNDTLRGKAYIYLDEALFSGDRKSADALKSLSTATTSSIEQKGVPTVQLPIALNFFLATNHEDAAHIEEADARYWILEVSPHRVGNSDYFRELITEIEEGGREVFMFFLFNLDVKDFVPSRDVPKDNDAKKAMIHNSINPYDARKWLEDCFNTGMILGFKPLGNKLPYEKSDIPWEPWVTGNEYDNGSLYVAYIEWQKSIKSPIAPKTTASNKFGELLNNVGFVEPRIQGGKKWRTLPDPETCKQKLNELIGKAKK